MINITKTNVNIPKQHTKQNKTQNKSAQHKTHENKHMKDSAIPKLRKHKNQLHKRKYDQ